jgi:hypothetical protein
MVACVLIVLSVALVAHAWPLSQPAFSSYDDRLGYRPYQALIDDVTDKGGLVFWSMTEARDFHEYVAGPLGTVTIKTEPHPESMLMTTGYTGFGGLYQDGRTIVKPGELWDRLLQLPISEHRPIPVLIGELAFHGLNDAGKDLNRLLTVLSVKERTVAGVLEALRSGHAYAVITSSSDWRSFESCARAEADRHRLVTSWIQSGRAISWSGFPSLPVIVGAIL